MNTKYSALVAVAACLLSASSIQAQTFAGQEKLSTLPVGLEASVYPIINAPATIKVCFNNLTAGGVKVIIRDEKGHAVYEAFETAALYRRRFDLSPMPAGTYTLELRKQNDLLTQTFSIEPPASTRIAMTNKQIRKTPEAPVDKKLIVSY